MLPNLKTARKLFFVTCVLFAPAAYAADFNYVNPDKISPEFIVTPPAPNSALYNNEVQEILKTQSLAIPADIAAAKNEEHLTPDVMDKNITRADHPKTFALL